MNTINPFSPFVVFMEVNLKLNIFSLDGWCYSNLGLWREKTPASGGDPAILFKVNNDKSIDWLSTQLSRYSSLLYGFYTSLSLYYSEGWIVSQLANFAKVFLLDVILNLLLIFVGVLNLLQWLIGRLAREWRTVQCSCWPGNCFFWKTTITFVIQLT